MVARITPNKATATVSVVKARASVSVVAPVVGVAVAVPVADISYILMTPSAFADTTGRYKYTFDFAVVEDAAVIAFTKAVSDAIGVGDSAPVFDVNKGLTDTVSMQEAFTRTLVFIRNFADSAGVSDAAAYAYVKALAHSVSLGDASVFTLHKLLSDGVAMNDSFDATDGSQWAFTKGVSNVAFATESHYFSMAKVLADTVEMLETLSFDTTKALADSASVADALAHDSSLAKTDAASVDDAKAIAFTLAPRSDSVSVSDVSNITPNKGLSESASTADAGYLYSQGYCDLTYFADDYVGDYRTF